MTNEIILDIFNKILRIDSHEDLIEFSLEINDHLKRKKIATFPAMCIQMAIHSKENELAIIQLFSIINEIAIATSEDIRSTHQPKGPLH